MLSLLALAAQSLTLTPCRLPGWSEDVRCGTYTVYEDRRRASGRTIPLRVVVLPATAAAAGATPVFYFSGGPGQSAVDLITRAGPTYLAPLRREHDLVFVERRGTGSANGLPCDLYGTPPSLAAFFTGTFPLDAVTACRAQLERHADLALYTTALASADVDDVRRALGYERIDLYGGSYGSTAALDYIRRYGAHVRSATLLGVAPPEDFYPLPFSRGAQHAIDVLFADCAADAACARAFPTARADFDSVLARLDRAPVTVEMPDGAAPTPNGTVRVTVTRDGFAEHVRLLLYDENVARLLPLLFHDAASGDFRRFVAFGARVYRATDEQIARGLQFSVVCPEAMPGVDQRAAEREAAASFYGLFRLTLYRAACARWPGAAVPASVRTPVTSAVPVLMLSGDADPVAPPWLGAEAVTHLANGRQVVVPHSGHDVSGACVDSITVRFVRSASARALDASCAVAHVRPKFVTPEMMGGR